MSLLVAFWPCAADVSSAELTNGRRVLLDRGLQIQALGFISSTPAAPTSYATWARTNFTTFCSWYDTNSEKNLGWTMPWSRWMRTDGTNPLTNNEKNQHLAELVSLQYGDELNNATGVIDSVTLLTIASTFENWRSQYGTDFIAYTNFNGNNGAKAMTPAGLTDYMLATNPDMLMFDAYPRQYVSLSTWYAEMQKYRQAGLAGAEGTGERPLPYAQYLDLYRTSYTASLPGESFVRLQEFASWAFGYTFVTAFVYNKPNNSSVYPTLFAGDGDVQPTVVLDQVAEANRQSLNLGPALVRLLSTDVRMIPGTSSALPAGINGWARGAGGNNYITGILPITGQGGGASSSYSDVIIGYFEPLIPDNSDYPYASGTHFMLVNGASSGSAASKAQWYRITFDFGGSGFNSLQLLSRDTGQVVLLPLTRLTGSQYALDWQLEGGTGDLLRFWDAHLPADLNKDEYVDAADVTTFLKCQNGPLEGPALTCPAGVNADLDGDNHVDQADFGLFQRCLSGADEPIASCAD